MSDPTILYAGIVCFSLIILGFVLTAREFSGLVPNVRKESPLAPLPAGHPPKHL